MSTTPATNEHAIRRELANVDDWLAWLERERRRAEGKRDLLLCRLTDLEGAHDRRPVAVR